MSTTTIMSACADLSFFPLKYPKFVMDDEDDVSLLNLPTGISKVEAVVVSFNSVKFTQLEKLGLTVYPMR